MASDGHTVSVGNPAFNGKIYRSGGIGYQLLSK
jgi:hypothetical protein